MLVRRTRHDDLPQLPVIEQSSVSLFSDPYLALPSAHVMSANDHVRFLAEGLHWVAVNVKDQPIGFKIATRLDGTLYVNEFAVMREQQWRGVGRLLMNAVIDQARREHSRAVTLTTYRDIPWNAPFYAKLGFEELAASELTAGLVAQLEREACHGHDPARRCAMSLRL